LKKIYGKTLENIRDRHDFEFVNYKQTDRARHLFSKPNFKDRIMFAGDENISKKPNEIKLNKNSLLGVLSYKHKTILTKPIYLGMSILEYSKLHMYKFYYNTINVRWPKNEIIGFDTDSFFLNIQREDIYKDMEDIKDELDTSDFDSKHPLFSSKNKKVIGKFKDELNGKIMNEICFLKSKAYEKHIELKVIQKIKRN
jgi:hypothetical protein